MTTKGSTIASTSDTAEEGRRPFHRSSVILILLAGPLALLGGAEQYGANPVWVFLGGPIVAAAWGISLAVVLWRLSALSRPLRGLLIAVVVSLVATGAMNFGPLMRAFHLAGAYLHLQMHRTSYEAKIARLNGSPKLAVFPRGGWLSMSEGIVYDESDEILLAPEARSANWKAQTSTTEVSCGLGDVRHLTGHFYVAFFGC
jgi:hypothetical protein